MRRTLMLVLVVFIITLSGCVKGNNEIDVYDSLPELRVSADEEIIIPQSLEHVWRWKDCNHVLKATNNPFFINGLENEEAVPTLKTTQSKLIIDFDKNPDNILEVVCWSDKAWEGEEVETEFVNFNSREIELKKGGYIYKITAEWNDKSDANGYGQISYCFHVNAEYN